MKTNADIRKTAWNAMWKGGWFFRTFAALVVALSLAFAFHWAWAELQRFFGVVTWEDFNMAKMQALASGMDYSVPSRRAAWMMTLASVMKGFFHYFVSGAMAYFVASVSLSAVKNSREGWVLRSSGAFASPFSVAALAFLQQLFITLWTLLFIVPGIVAAYRYSQAWILKCENPSWGAMKCIAESKRLMAGRKWALCKLDCSYVWAITALLAFLLGLTAGVVFDGAEDAVSLPLPVTFALLSAAGAVAAVVGIYFNFGRAVFYREITGKEGEKECMPTLPT